MKEITMQQWSKMNARQRSWLVCRALGEKARVFWHCTKPDGSRVSGSLLRRSQCVALIQHARGLTASKARKLDVPYPHPYADCVALPAVSYPRYAEYDHLGASLGMGILKERGIFKLSLQGQVVAAETDGAHASADSVQEAVSLLVLKLRGFIRKEAGN